MLFRCEKLTPLEQLVASGRKPGAFVLPGYDAHESGKLYAAQGIEAVDFDSYGYRQRAIGKATAAADVWERFDLTPHLREYTPRLERLVSEIGSKTIAPALVFLNDYPRDTYRNPSNLEKPEVAIVEGALLGYHSGCVDYYVATRYDGESVHSKVFTGSEPAEEPLPVAHILCPSCEKTA